MGSAGVIIYPKSNMSATLENDFAEGASRKLSEEDARKRKMQGAVFLGCVSSFFIMFGFGTALVMAKRRDPVHFGKGLTSTRELPETGADLAMRALGWASLYSVGGFSLFCYGVWKMMGVSNLSEFNEKMQELIPRRPQPVPQGRTEFQSLRDLFTYLETLGRKNPETKD